MSGLLRHPLFPLGLALRLVIAASVSPAPVTEWYAPFLETASFSPDPWAVWLAAGGSLAAFPYGYAQWLMFLPATALFKAAGLPVFYAYYLTLLAADAGLLATLRAMRPGRDTLLLFAYWLSPIVILGTYFLGLNDILPSFLLLLSLFYMRGRRCLRAGFLCVAAVSAKLSMLIAAPFFLIYLWHNKPMRRLIPLFLKGAGLAAALFLGPFMLSASGRLMLFSNQELNKVVQLSIEVSRWASVQVVPLAYLLVLYAAWRLKRLNYGLFEALLGIAFFTIILLMPGSLGWFVWMVPFLVLYQAQADRLAAGLVFVFSLFYLAAGSVPGWLAGAFGLPPLFFRQIPSSLYTVMTALGVVICVRMWREAVRRNDFFRFSKKPFVIGIAGDSGSGKDTLASSLVGLFGRHSVACLSGDDYHHWDRHENMWKVITHLNPMANDLEAFTRNLVDLIDGKPIQARRY
ncbi:MAG: uridine kinase, partial [Candidatus Adiutrix sp.]|nr:uridine kinase [Candidatus Adiutrix sp.]